MPYTVLLFKAILMCIFAIGIKNILGSFGVTYERPSVFKKMRSKFSHYHNS